MNSFETTKENSDMKINQTMRIMDIIKNSTVDGEGFRNVLFTAGCLHHCKNCHNPETWSLDSGHDMDVTEAAEKLCNGWLSNVTISGGDPFYQPNALHSLLIIIKNIYHKNVWVYTGFTYEELINLGYDSILESIDVLIDGLYVDELRDINLIFKGSSNQRVIDIKETLKSGSVTLYNIQ